MLTKKVNAVKDVSDSKPSNLPALKIISCRSLGLTARIRSPEQAKQEKSIFDSLGCLQNFEYD